MYVLLKHTHLLAVTLSFIAFFIRGLLMIRESQAANHRAFLIAPHIINTFLIASGIALAVTLHLSPSSQPWLIAKLVALVIYIVLGVLAFKHPNLNVRKILWMFALIVFIYIVSVARSKNPLVFFAMLF